ncbi:hypothetical protein CR203_01265 [Salipaludibacillus neizhouensis]|uniref:Sin domain-containing protein n=1 Tax=Salipaludibacillus neizhouensis TaxID=885475 RepID=A0A3A9KDY1_9BACI|nr:anti-repressor SinI family protein [Salipaludibacillus neizhouensis]RKL68711.1 hypothetical protein CR203_01265 [Salipaludibacillus neizhouensis]
MEKQYRYQLDEEWTDLILQAKNLGLKTEEVREFLLITITKNSELRQDKI